MSKLTRIVLASLVTLAVVIGIYTSVEGASVSAQQDQAGAHLVSGPKVNLDHYREAIPAPINDIQSQFDKGSGGGGHGCESESQTSPLD
jgi:hypothetical protein